MDNEKEMTEYGVDISQKLTMGFISLQISKTIEDWIFTCMTVTSE